MISWLSKSRHSPGDLEIHNQYQFSYPRFHDQKPAHFSPHPSKNTPAPETHPPFRKLAVLSQTPSLGGLQSRLCQITLCRMKRKHNFHLFYIIIFKVSICCICFTFSIFKLSTGIISDIKKQQKQYKRLLYTPYPDSLLASYITIV